MTDHISIAVPTYEYNGKSGSYLRRLFSTIETQDFKNFNVCVSDQSLNNDVVEVCEEYSNKFNIYFHKNYELTNPTKNINNALRLAEGKIVKVMFLDDFFYSNHALSIINSKLESSNLKWAICSTAHYNENNKTIANFLKPRWNDNLLDGINTMGSPTVMAYKKEYEQLFDESLRLFVDVEMYYRMQKINDFPLFIDETLVVTSIDENSTLGRMQNNQPLLAELSRKESIYCKEKATLNE